MTRLLPAGPVVPEKSTTPPALVMKRAKPPVLLPVKMVWPNALVVMMASSAVLELLNCSVPGAPETPLTTKVGALPEMSATPSPWITSEEGTPTVPVMLKVNAGAPVLNCKAPTCVLACWILTMVTFEALNCAISVAVGTVPVVQLAPVFQSPAGIRVQRPGERDSRCVEDEEDLVRAVGEAQGCGAKTAGGGQRAERSGQRTGRAQHREKSGCRCRCLRAHWR